MLFRSRKAIIHRLIHTARADRAAQRRSQLPARNSRRGKFERPEPGLRRIAGSPQVATSEPQPCATAHLSRQWIFSLVRRLSTGKGRSQRGAGARCNGCGSRIYISMIDIGRTTGPLRLVAYGRARFSLSPKSTSPGPWPRQACATTRLHTVSERLLPA